MRRHALPLIAAIALLAGCVTINVYFPAAAAKKAADQVISNIIGPEGAAPDDSAPPSSGEPAPAASVDDSPRGTPLAMRVLDALVPPANAAEPVNLDIQTPAIEAIEARMRSRFHATLKALLDSGAIGFTHDGNVAIHDPAKIPLPERARVQQALAAENADRAQLYKQIGIANGHPEWAQSMREAFAKRWISRARPGWYYQDASGNWQRK